MITNFGPSQAGRDFIRILRCHVKNGAALVSAALAEAKELSIANADIIIAAIDRERFKAVSLEPVDLSEYPALLGCKVVMCPDLTQYGVLTGGKI